MIIFVSIVVGIISFSFGFVLGGLWKLDGNSYNRQKYADSGVITAPDADFELDYRELHQGLEEGEDE